MQATQAAYHPAACPDCGALTQTEVTGRNSAGCHCAACGWSTDPEPEPEDCEDWYDDSMDGDHASALASCGWGTDEDYGCYDAGGDW